MRESDSELDILEGYEEPIESSSKTNVRGKKKTSVVYRSFTTDAVNKKAICKNCRKTLTYNTRKYSEITNSIKILTSVQNIY